MAALAVSGLSLEWRREENLNLDFFSGLEGADMVSVTIIKGRGESEEV